MAILSADGDRGAAGSLGHSRDQRRGRANQNLAAWGGMRRNQGVDLGQIDSRSVHLPVPCGNLASAAHGPSPTLPVRRSDGVSGGTSFSTLSRHGRKRESRCRAAGNAPEDADAGMPMPTCFGRESAFRRVVPQPDHAVGAAVRRRHVRKAHRSLLPIRIPRLAAYRSSVEASVMPSSWRRKGGAHLEHACRRLRAAERGVRRRNER